VAFAKTVGKGGVMDQTTVELVDKIMTFGGRITAEVHQTFPQIKKASKKKRKVKGRRAGQEDEVDLEDGEEEEEEDGIIRKKKRNNIIAATGETRSAPKILNSLKRMELLKAAEEEKETQGLVQAEHNSNRANFLAPVVSRLLHAKVIKLTSNKMDRPPTLKELQTYIRVGGTERETAWVAYRIAREMPGKTIPWKLYFDFVYRGAEDGEWLQSEDVSAAALPAPIVQDKSDLNKFIKTTVEKKSSAVVVVERPAEEEEDEEEETGAIVAPL
jgi:hypothetical protein